MGLSAMKQDLHDRLWAATQRWLALRGQGYTKHGLKIMGIRHCGDANLLLRDLIFSSRTRETYEEDLKRFVEYVHERHGVQELRLVNEKHARAYLELALDQRWAAKTIHKVRSELAKLGALIGKTESFAALSREYGAIVREQVRGGIVKPATRATPTRHVVERAIELLHEWDVRHEERTGAPRAYHLAARLQLETAARCVSVTERFTVESLRPNNIVFIRGKGGRPQEIPISPQLWHALHAYLVANPGSLAGRHGYRMAYQRAVQAAAGTVTGTHGVRRLSAQEHYKERYQKQVARGNSTKRARVVAREDSVERLGHSRDRGDQANWYLGR